VSGRSGRVFIIGAGPGDPGLVSVRGVRLLAEADVIVYDRAAAGALRWARPDAERIEAGAPAEHDTAQDALSMLVAEKARDGEVVARLKWGDAFVFDSGAKEALFLHEQGVPFEVVPGIPSAIGATAYAGIPVTYPGSGDTLVLLRGYEGGADTIPDVDWSALGRLDGTILCHAGGRVVPTVLDALLAHGVAGTETAALIYRGTLPSQQTVTGTLHDLLATVAASPDPEPALIVVGEVASLRDHLRWFDERPLFGRRIVVTRSHEQAQELVELFENLGAQAIEAPTFRLAPPDDPEAVNRAAASVDDYSWLVFESANAVGRFLSALTRGPRDLRALGPVSVCAIGPSTADRLTASGIKPDVVVPEFRVESVAEAIAARGPVVDQRVLLVRPDHLRDVLAETLTRHGAAVTDLVAYRTTTESSDAPAVQDVYRMLLDGKIDAVTFASPTAVRQFAAILGEDQAADLLRATVVATMGPVTAAAAAELGIHTTVMPETFTVEGLVAAVVKYFEPNA
jgi:uroporphyrinogen III methyltransferase / synthase